MNKNRTKAELLLALEQAQKRIKELEAGVDPRENEDHFAKVFNASPAQMALTDEVTGKFVAINAAFLQALGFTAEDVLGKTSLELSLFVDAEQRAVLLQRMQAQGHLRDEYVLVRAKNGEVRHGIFSAEYIHANRQKLLLTVMNDVTEKIRAEQRWQFALEGSGDGVWDWDPQTNRVFFSRQWKAMLGYAEDEVSDGLDEWQSRVHPDDLAAVMVEVSRHLAGETPVYNTEHRVRCKDGTYKWILDIGKVIEWSEDHRPLRVIGTHRDISKRKAAEEKVRENEERFSHMFHANPSAQLLVTLREGKILDANRAFLEQTGFGYAELIGRTARELNLWAEPARQRKLVEQLQAGVHLHDQELDFRTRQGETRTLLVSFEVVELRGLQCIISSSVDISERKKAEQIVEQNERLYHSLIEALDISLCRWRPDSTLTYANDKYKQLFGIVGDEQGVQWFDLLPEETRPTTMAFYKNVLASPHTITYEHPVALEQGVVREYQWIDTPIFDDQGRVLEFQSVGIDITERKQAERALAESEELYRLTLSNISDAVVITDSFGNFTFVCPNINVLFGYQATEVLAMQHISGLFETPLFDLAALERAGEISNIECMITDKYGNKHDLLVNVKHISIRRGTILYTCHDISERKQAEQAIQEAERKYRMLVEQSPAIVYVDEVNGHWQYLSPQLENVTGYKPEEFIQERGLWKRIVHPEDLPRLQTETQRGIQNASRVVVEYRVFTREGRLIWLHDEADPFVDPHTGRVLLRGVLRDITERKQAEAGLLESEERFRTFIEQSVDGFLLVAEDGNILECNHALAGITGMAREHVLGMALWDLQFQLAAPEKRPPLERLKGIIQGMLQTGQHPTFGQVNVNEIETAQGERRFIQQSSYPIRTSRGFRIGAVIRDVTKLKHLELALQKNEERYRLISSAVTDYAYSARVDENGTFTMDWVAGAFEEITGYTFEEFVARGGWRASLHPDDLPIDEQARTELLANRKTVNEVRIFSKSGQIVYLSIYARPIWDEQNNRLKAIYGAVQNITARKLMEKELEAETVRRRVLFEESPDGILIIDPQTAGFVEFNTTAHTQLGYTREEFAKLHIFEVEAKETAAETQTHIEAVVRNGRADFETLQLTKQGELRSVQVTAQIVKINDQPVYYCIWRDITEQKRAEEARRESDDRYHLLFQNMVQGVVFQDGMGRIIHANPAAERILGLTLDQMLGLASIDPHWHSIHEDGAPFPGESHPAMQSLASGQPVNNVVMGVFNPDTQAYRWINVNATPRFMNGEPEPYQVFTTFEDITERKQSEEEIRLAEQRYRALIENAPDGIVLVSQDGKFKYASPSVERIFGYTREDILAGSPNQLTHPEDLPMVVGELATLIQDPGYQPTLQYRFLHKNGEWRWIESTFSNLINLPSVEAIIINFRDVHERKLAEENLRSEQLRLAKIADTIPGALMTFQLRTDGSLRIPYGSKAFEDLYGLKLADVSENINALIEHVSPDQTNFLVQSVMDSARTMLPWRHEYEYLHPQKGRIWLEGFSVPVQEADGTLLWHGVTTDITERKREERYIQARLRLANLSYEDMEMETLLRTMLDEAEALTDSQVGFFHFVDDDQNTISLQAWSTNTLKTLCTAEGKGQHYPVEQAGVWADGIRSGEARIYNEYVSLPQRRELPEGHAPISRLITLPIKRNNRVVAAIGVGNKPSNYSAHDVEMIKRLAEDAFDIILRKRAELQLRASEEKYRGLMESLDNVITTVDEHGRFLYINPVGASQLGIPLQELVGKTMHELFPEKVAALQMDHIRQVIQSGQALINEAPTMIRGQLRWYKTTIQPIDDPASGVKSVLINSVDVHDLKTAQQELEELNRTLEAKVTQRTAEVQDLYDNAPIGYHSIDANRRFTRVNQTELKMLGYTREELIGQSIDLVFQTKEKPVLEKEFQQLVMDGKTTDLEVTTVRKDGSTFPAMINAVAIYDEQGQFASTRSTLTDITQRKAVEEAVRHANAELERALRMKDEFLANMSHELRTPLNAILGLSESLLEETAGPLNDKQMRYLGTVSESGKHLLELINDILDLAKVESGQIRLELQNVDVQGVCDASLRMVKQLAQKKNQTVKLEVAGNIGLVRADERRLKQMIVNLLSNAVKFTPDNGRLGLEAQLDPETMHLLITVWDEGIGIAEKDITRLFQPFVQLDSRLSRESAGTGLGLALVAEMARLHGGSIRVESTPGHGSRFILTLPWEPDLRLEPSERLKMTGKFHPVVERADGERPTILLVEDTDHVVMMVTDYLELAGYHVEVARNGLDGINRARAVHPALILMDVQMPGMDGLEATRYIRQDATLQATPILALTALAMPSDRERCLAAGMNDYISKPVNLKQLVKTIETHLK